MGSLPLHLLPDWQRITRWSRPGGTPLPLILFIAEPSSPQCPAGVGRRDSGASPQPLRQPGRAAVVGRGRKGKRSASEQEEKEVVFLPNVGTKKKSS